MLLIAPHTEIPVSHTVSSFLAFEEGENQPQRSSVMFVGGTTSDQVNLVANGQSKIRRNLIAFSPLSSDVRFSQQTRARSFSLSNFQLFSLCCLLFLFLQKKKRRFWKARGCPRLGRKWNIFCVCGHGMATRQKKEAFLWGGYGMAKGKTEAHPKWEKANIWY